MQQPVPRFSRWRVHLVQDLVGDILEIGVGSGANLPYYRQARHLWAIEPDPASAAQAQQMASRAAVPVIVKVAPAEHLPFEDAFFDHVVSSLVFCSVTDPPAALAEVRRVLKPGGTLHMVEHVRPDAAWLAWLFGSVTPAWSRVAHNCHLDRPTVDLLQENGWKVQVHRRRGVFVRLSATVR